MGTPPPQVVTVYSSSTAPAGYGAAATTTTGGSWLTVAPGLGTTSSAAPDSSTITASTAGLAQGVYYGGVSYASGTGVSTVNVTMIVQPAGGGAAGAVVAAGATPKALTSNAACSPTTLVPTQTGLVNNFSAPVSWPTPLAITLYNDCGSAVGNGQVVATFSNGDPPLALPLAMGPRGSIRRHGRRARQPLR